MPVLIVVPPLGESVVEATVSKWMKGEGDRVERDEALVELETEKINVEVTAFKGGILARIAAPEGEKVRIGEKLGVIALDGEKLTEEEIERLIGKEKKEILGIGVRQELILEEEPEEAGEVKASPAAKKLARDHGLDLRKVRGSGRSGRIMEKDVLDHVHRLAATRPSLSQEERVEERIPMSPMRKRIAEHMVRSKQVSPHVTTVDEVDMGKIVELRNRFRATIEEKHGLNLTYLPFIVKAVTGGLRDFPRINSSVEGEEIVLKKYYNIGIAVALDEGLLVPVIKGADRKSIVELARAIEDLSRRARERQLTPAEVMGSTFSITNAGIFGALLSTPIINQPNVAILGVHKVSERPVALEGQLAIRPMMYLTLSFDHRAVDGKEAVLFLGRVKELLENPEILLLDR